MRMFKPTTMYEMVMPMLLANCITGMEIWPVKSRGRIISIVYSLCCLIIYCILMKVSMTYLDAYYLNKANDFGNLTFQALFYANICLTLCLIVTGWRRIKVMQAVLGQFATCEKAMEQMGIQKNYQKLFLLQLYSFGIVAVVMIGFIAINYNAMFLDNTPTHVKFILAFASHYPVGLLYVADVTFLHWVRYSKARFAQLNSLLQRMLTTTPDSPQHKRVLKMRDEWNKTFVTSVTQSIRNNKDNTDTIRAVKQVHLELIKSTRKANEAYGIQILLSMTVSFVFITSLLYDAYSIIWINMSTHEFRREMMSIVCWTLFYTSKVFLINHTCGLTSIEAANTGDIICELYEPSTSKEFRAEIRDFTLQLIQNPLIFTACGFFNLDHTFIHGVIGSITTYLVILIQVGGLPSPMLNSTMSYDNTTDLITTNVPL